MDDYLDRELTPVEIELVEQHLETCVVCAREYEFEATLVAELKGRLGRIAVPQSVLTSVQATLDEARTRSERRNR